MTATFWTGSSLSFTNGSKTVTVNTGPSLDSVKANSSLTAGNYNEPVEVKSVSGNTITLYNNWPGSTGTTSATIKPSAAAAASAGVAAQQLITDIQSLVSSASATATANSFVKRDSNGRIKAASPSANDDVVTKGYLGDAATRGVGAENGNLIPVGLLGFASPDAGSSAAFDFGNARYATGLYPVSIANSTGEKPVASGFGTVLALAGTSGNASHEFFLSRENTDPDELIKFRTKRNSGVDYDPWVHLKHSGNTNFNEFGGISINHVVAQGAALNNNYVLFYLPINSHTPPTGITVEGTFKVRTPFNNAMVKANVVPKLFGISSNKVACIGFDTLAATGLSQGDVLELVAESSTSKITVNF